MKELPCHHFFLQPTGTLHRRYEALRAVFVERRPVKTVAQHFGYSYGTLRNLVHEFRVQWAAQQVPPFSQTPPWAARAILTPGGGLGALSTRQLRTVASWR